MKVFSFAERGQKPLDSCHQPLWQVNGPWKVSSSRPTRAWSWVPNENYWGEDKPKIDKLIYKAFTGDDAA